MIKMQKINFRSKKKSNNLKIMHNFILINKFIIKSIYSIYKIDEIINIIIKSKYEIYFYTNVFNEY